jgi:hypothetical protein
MFQTNVVEKIKVQILCSITFSDNIKMDLREVGVGGGGMDWISLAGSGQGQVAGSCECDDEPSGSIKCGDFLE